MPNKAINKISKYLKTKILGLVLYSLFPLAFYAQNTKDSILLQDFIHQETLTENPYLAFLYPVNEYTLTELSYQNSTLKLKRTQAPKYENDFQFNTKGLLKMSNKLLLSGSTSFVRQSEKEVSHILDNERTTEQFTIVMPYYYVLRPGDWKNQNYNITANLAYQPIQNLFLQISAKGNYSQNSRIVDARPETKNVNYDASGKIGYAYKNHILAAGGGYQNFDKSIDIYYEETLLNNNVLYPETFLRLNEGYGNSYIVTGNTVKQLYKNTGNYFNAEYSYIKPDFLLNIGYQNAYNFTTLYNDFYTNPNRKILALKKNQDKIYAHFQKKWQNKFWNTQIETLQYTTLNYNYLKKSTSNKQEEFALKLKNLYNIQKNNHHTFYGVDFAFGKFRSQDLSVVLDKTISYAYFNLTFGKELPVDTHRKIFFNTQQGLYLPLNEKFAYTPFMSSQENVFVRDIAQPDHFYDTTYRYMPHFQIGYRQKNTKLNWQLSLETKQMFYLKNKIENNAQPKNSNLQWATSLKIFY